MSASPSHTRTNDPQVRDNSSGQTPVGGEEKARGGDGDGGLGQDVEKDAGDAEIKDPNLVSNVQPPMLCPLSPYVDHGAGHLGRLQ